MCIRVCVCVCVCVCIIMCTCVCVCATDLGDGLSSGAPRILALQLQKD